MKVKDEYEPFTDEGWKGGTVCSENSEQFAKWEVGMKLIP